MVKFVQKFAPRLAEITTPLRDLIKKGNEFKWDEHVHGKALDEIRQTLAEPPVLRFFDPNVTPVLQCDASMNWKQIKWNVFVKCSSFVYDFIKYS